MKAHMKKKATGDVKEVKVGFSWTVFFFGFFPPLFRGDVKWAAIMLLAEVALGAFTNGAGGAVICIAFAFIYNKLYVKELIKKGYAPVSQADEDVFNSKGYLS